MLLILASLTSCALAIFEVLKALPFRRDVVEVLEDKTPRRSAVGRARIAYALPKAGSVDLALYDASGRLARTLVHGDNQAGVYTTSLPATGLARGVYLLRYRSGAYEATRKLIIQ